jgi:hypothetical protein
VLFSSGPVTPLIQNWSLTWLDYKPRLLHIRAVSINISTPS